MPTEIVFEEAVADHDPELYQGSEHNYAVDGLDGIDETARQRYDEDGFLVVRRGLPESVWRVALDELKSMAAMIDPECATVTYEGSLRARIHEMQDQAIQAEIGEDDPGADGEKAETIYTREAIERLSAGERAASVRKLMGFTRAHKPLRDVANYPSLRAVVNAIVGEKSRMFQSMALLKPPGGREKPWHQDHAYFDLPVDCKVCGVWIALGEVTPANGAMYMLRGGHRAGPIVHYHRRDWQICDSEIAGSQAVVLPMSAGDLVLFDAKIPHGTPTNRTREQRWALQFHYVGGSVESVPVEQRLAVFGSEGKNVSC